MSELLVVHYSDKIIHFVNNIEGTPKSVRVLIMSHKTALESTYVGLQKSSIVTVVDKKMLGIAVQFPHCNYTVGPYGSGPIATYLYIKIANEYMVILYIIINNIIHGLKGHV